MKLVNNINIIAIEDKKDIQEDNLLMALSALYILKEIKWLYMIQNN